MNDPNKIYTKELIREIAESAKKGSDRAKKIMKLFYFCRANALLRVTRRLLEQEIGNWKEHG